VRPIGSIARLAAGGFRAQIVEHGAAAFRWAPANVAAGRALLCPRRDHDADPVGQCALTTVAEDTVQFIAPLTDLVSLSEDEGVVSGSIGTWLTTRFIKAARRKYRFSRITPFRIAQVPVRQQHAGRNGLALLCDTGHYKIRIGRRGASEDLAGGTGAG
jgi:hypothetical protein